jgi:hypothetical protein
MLDSPDSLSAEVEHRIQAVFEELPLAPGLVERLASQLVESAVEVKKWSVHQFLTLREREGEFTLLNLSGARRDVPTVVYYRPAAAANVAASVLSGAMGATNGILIALAVISGILALGGVRTATSAAESLLFWVVYSADGHCLTREQSRACFEAEASSVSEIDNEDFEPALHALVQLGCLRVAGDSIAVADKVILHRR